MNIIQANKYYYMRGGAERYYFNVSELLEEHGHNVIPFAMQHKENQHSQWAKFFPSYVPTRSPALSLDGLRTFGRMIYSSEAKRKMSELIQQSRPDICHVHNIYTQLSPSILDALRRRNIPTVMTVHDYHLLAPNYMLWSHNKIENWGQTGLLRATMSRFHKDSYAASFAQALMYKVHRWRRSWEQGIDKFIAPAEFVREIMIENGFKAEQIVTIPYFFDVSEIETKQESDEGYILFVGRLVSEKGADVLIRAMKELPDVKCKILGSGPDEEWLREWAADVPNVEFLGWRKGEPAWDLYRGARAVVVPSLWYEVFGLVALEAMATGTAVIASDTGGLANVFEDGVSGRLFPPGDVGALVERIREMVDNPELALEFGCAGRKRAEEVYGPEKHYQDLTELYKSVM